MPLHISPFDPFVHMAEGAGVSIQTLEKLLFEFKLVLIEVLEGTVLTVVDDDEALLL